jgi:hypothetical protein
MKEIKYIDVGKMSRRDAANFMQAYMIRSGYTTKEKEQTSTVLCVLVLIGAVLVLALEITMILIT